MHTDLFSSCVTAIGENAIAYFPRHTSKANILNFALISLKRVHVLRIT